MEATRRACVHTVLSRKRLVRTGSKDNGKGPRKGKRTQGNQKEASKDPEDVPSDDDGSDSDAEKLRWKIFEEGGMNISEAEASGSGRQEGETGDGNRAEEEEIDTEGAAVTRKKTEAARKRAETIAKKAADKKAEDARRAKRVAEAKEKEAKEKRAREKEKGKERERKERDDREPRRKKSRSRTRSRSRRRKSKLRSRRRSRSESRQRSRSRARHRSRSGGGVRSLDWGIDSIIQHVKRILGSVAGNDGELCSG